MRAQGIQKQPGPPASRAKALLEQGFPSQETCWPVVWIPLPGATAACGVPGRSRVPSSWGSPACLCSWADRWRGSGGEEGTLAILLPLGVGKGLGVDRKGEERREAPQERGRRVPGEGGQAVHCVQGLQRARSSKPTSQAQRGQEEAAARPGHCDPVSPLQGSGAISPAGSVPGAGMPGHSGRAVRVTRERVKRPPCVRHPGRVPHSGLL